ncbi:MAG: phage prohead protease, family [Phycisphaerales bacterium]|nr:phage prohead protease, family [Phycisphaerales bacterium]
MKPETRLILAASELRAEPAAADKPARLVGYAAVFNSPSEDLGGFRETIRPGAFARTLADAGRDVRALVDHDPGKLLGRTSAGTLAVTEDAKGLRIAAHLPDTSYAKDLASLIERGDVRGMSFAFRVNGADGEKWSEVEGATRGTTVVVRELIDVDLYEVTVTSVPAYRATEIDLRSVDPAAVEHAKAVAGHRLKNLLNRKRQLRGLYL